MQQIRGGFNTRPLKMAGEESGYSPSPVLLDLVCGLARAEQVAAKEAERSVLYDEGPV